MLHIFQKREEIIVKTAIATAQKEMKMFALILAIHKIYFAEIFICQGAHSVQWIMLAHILGLPRKV